MTHSYGWQPQIACISTILNKGRWYVFYQRRISANLNFVSIPIIHQSILTLLSRGNDGLFIVDVNPETDSNAYTVHPITTQGIVELALSPTADTLTYLTETGSTYIVISPNPESEPRLLISTEGWINLPRQPTIVGMEPLPNGLVFATAEDGAFVYDSSIHRYHDFSSVSGANATRTVESFSSLMLGTDALFAVADGDPFIFPVIDEISEYEWQTLDPENETNPISLTHSDEIIYGVSEHR